MAAKHTDRKIPRPASRPLETLTKIAAQNLDGDSFIAYLLSRTVVPSAMAQVINPPIMNVTFEHPTIIFDNKIAEVIIEFVNHILYADSEETLRQIVADFADKYDLDRYFVYGYGSHHLWLKQRKITNPDITFEYRILIVEY